MSEFYPSSIEDTSIHYQGNTIKRYTYNEIHNLIKEGASKLDKIDFKPDYIIAIGGGGLIPARILRTYIDVPILTITISYYERDSTIPSKEPIVIQTVDLNIIRDKNVLIVDEVDDTRRTLTWVMQNLLDTKNYSKYCIFVVHNKDKEKVDDYDNLFQMIPYISCQDVEDKWIKYPWDVE